VIARLSDRTRANVFIGLDAANATLSNRISKTNEVMEERTHGIMDDLRQFLAGVFRLTPGAFLRSFLAWLGIRISIE
jgi:hypothetical protein